MLISGKDSDLADADEIRRINTIKRNDLNIVAKILSHE